MDTTESEAKIQHQLIEGMHIFLFQKTSFWFFYVAIHSLNKND